MARLLLLGVSNLGLGRSPDLITSSASNIGAHCRTVMTLMLDTARTDAHLLRSVLALLAELAGSLYDLGSEARL